MGFVVKLEVELDTEYASEAERLAHRLFEVVIDEDYVLSLAASRPEAGTIGPDEG